jgi:hypothetical protein
MALVCNKITKIKKLFTHSLSSNLDKLNLESLFSNIEKVIEAPHRIRLNHYLGFYNNLKKSNIFSDTSIKSKLNELENLLEEKILRGLEVHENFGYDNLNSTLQSKYLR